MIFRDERHSDSRDLKESKINYLLWLLIMNIYNQIQLKWVFEFNKYEKDKKYLLSFLLKLTIKKSNDMILMFIQFYKELENT